MGRSQEKISHWDYPLWQFVGGGVCSICEITGEETVQEYLVIVEGEGDTRYCKMCYFSKFVNPIEFEDEVEELNSEDLPPEVMTDAKGNTTLDNWS